MLSTEPKRQRILRNWPPARTAVFLRRSPQLTFHLLLLIAFVLRIPATAQTPAPATGCASGSDATAPCFAKVPDMLNGRKSLFPDDDLVVNTIVFPGGNNQVAAPSGANLLTSDSTITQTSPTQISSNSSAVSNVITVQAQLFSVNHHQVFSADSVQTNGQQAGVASLEGSDSSIKVPVLDVLNNAQQLYGTSGDFLGNGFDQIVVAAVNKGQLTFQMVAAKDPADVSQGLIAGNVSAPIANASTAFAITAGVFPNPNNPSAPAQVALLSASPTTNTGLVVTFYAVDSSGNVSPTGQSVQLALGPTTNIPLAIAIAAGRFGGAAYDQLAIAYPVALSAGQPTTVGIVTVDFDKNGNPFSSAFSGTGLAFLNFYPSLGYPPAVYLSTGKFNWFSSSDQLAISLGTNGVGGMQMGVMSFNSSLDGTMGFLYGESNSCHFGLAAGRFDSEFPNGQPDPNFQLGDVSTDCTGHGGYTANIYDVDPTNQFAITRHSQKTITSALGSSFGPITHGALALSLVAADEQGRSLLLGPPTKITIVGHSQPDTVLGVPPMHVDWIAPATGENPQILNVSVFPAKFFTEYSFSNTSGSSVSSSMTTSDTVSTQESANEEVSYGVPELADVSLEASQAATQLQENTIANQYNTYSNVSTTFSTQTVFDDEIAYTTSNFNIYSYRVLGQCATPANPNPDASSQDCPAGTVPLYIQFSGPDNVNHENGVEGRNLEWYQPVQEPGNLFSYPATTDQLEAELGGGTSFQALTSTGSYWDSQTTSSTSINWNQGGDASVSAGTTATNTFDASVSADTGVDFGGVGASVDVGFDYNDSNSLSTLNQNMNSYANSQGIILNNGVEQPSQVYDYRGSSFIYGRYPPPGVVQTDATPQTTIKANGFLTVGHVVDMLNQGGNFWQQAYTTYPDIALNHPQRWLQSTPSTGEEVQFQCPYGFHSSLSSPACAVQSTGLPTPPAGIADDGFYEMKGLFVTPGGTSNGTAITSTTAGSTVNLRVRVYNYSLKNFPANSMLHVQFYAQPWATGEFATVANDDQTFAPAVFIGETVLPPPPAFCNGFQGGSTDPCQGSSTLNWEYANTSWNTTGLPVPSYWKFWVVVWVEDSNGQLVAELPGHGLQSLPPENVRYNSLQDVPIETYSNNLGFYNQTFSVLAVSEPPGASGTKELGLGTIATRGNAPVVRDVPITILAPHIASGDHVDSIMSLYYDGDPAKGGTLFDEQRISRVEQGSTWVDTASYLPKTCGQHEIFVRAIPLDGTLPPATAEETFKVTRDPVLFIDELVTYLRKLPSPPHRDRHDFRSFFRDTFIDELKAVRQVFEKGRTKEGTIAMRSLLDRVRNGEIPLPEKARYAVAAEITELLGCV